MKLGTQQKLKGEKVEFWNKRVNKNAGRLNDLRHIIYKVLILWRQAKKIWTNVKRGLLKENIDRAINWAFTD